MIRVVHVCPAYFPYRGGIEILVESAAPILRDSFGVHSEVLAPRHQEERPERFIHNGTRVHSVDLVNSFSADAAPRAVVARFAKVRRVIENVEPQLIHIHGFSPLALAAASVARTRQIPYVAHIHGELEETPPSHLLRVIENADLRIAVSEAVRKSMASGTTGSLPVTVIPNGIAALPASLPGPENKVLLCIGRLESQKGFADAIAALPEILDVHPSACLRIIGSGQALYELQSLATRLKVAGAVNFLGALSHSAVLDQIRSSSIVLVPSRSIEGFSLVAAESAAVGRPVVATRVGGLIETVRDGETGVLVEPGSPSAISKAVNALLSDDGWIESLGRDGVSHAAKSFSIEDFARRMTRAYIELLEKS